MNSSKFHPGCTRRQRGVALIITLILLVVITTLTVAFLALSTRETASVNFVVANTDSEQANAAGVERSLEQIKAPFFARNTVKPLPEPVPTGATNRETMGPDLMVSVARDVPTDVPGVRMNLASDPAKDLRTLRTLGADAAPPVFVWTNKFYNTPSAVEPRDYVDLNRNGRFEPSGLVPSTNESGMPILDSNQMPLLEWRAGDPQWIGVLRDPTQPHSSSNQFIGRYAFIILPAGRTLDFNWIHNETKNFRRKTPVNGPGFTDYFRNQGVGTYELNLAAFLADVNPNYTNYTPFYRFESDPSSNKENEGVAFVDALEVLTNRYYQGDKTQLPWASALFASLGPMSLNYFPLDHINAYADGPLAYFGTSYSTATNIDNETPNRPWPGADSYKHYYTIHDLWNGGELPGFSGRLVAASARTDTHARYSYYRMLSEIGTDSLPEKDDRLNLNYKNNTNNTAIAKGAATNFIPWTAAEFFNAAADRMLTNEFFPYGITNVRLSGVAGEGIPVFTNGSVFINKNPNNLPIYMPRLHQLLQIAANLYEATLSNDTAIALPNPPTVFRPLFERKANGDIYITRYVEVGTEFKAALQSGQLKWHELDSAPTSLSSDDNFYDIPILFGARKGIPNFNEFTMHTLAEFKRNIEVRKDANGTKISTNQTFIMSVSNYCVVELWNSYGGETNLYPGYPNARYSYPRALEVVCANNSVTVLTNQAGLHSESTVTRAFSPSPIYNPGTWTNGYRLSTIMENAALTSSVFYLNPTPHFEVFNNVNPSEPIVRPDINRWGMISSNRFRFFLFDNGMNRLVDSFTSARMNTRFDISAELDRKFGGGGVAFDNLWSTRVTAGRSVADGVYYQMEVSRGAYGAQPPASGAWLDYGDLAATGFSTIAAAIRGFDTFLTTNTPNVFTAQAPFSPHARVLLVNSWQANDPLVHGTVYDLYDPPLTGETNRLRGRDPYFTLTNTVASSPGTKNQRYKPWGGRDGNSENPPDYDISEKDPGIFTPDYWDFPTQKFPNIGWLGRVHRGTPWQTIYLKSEDRSYSSTLSSAYTGNAWWKHVGAAYMPSTFPTNDWRLLDIFTAAIHPNATRGRLSINQTNLAAWSAVFAGVRTTTVVNDGNNIYNTSETVIQPHSVDVLNSSDTNRALLKLVEGINRTRRQPARGINNFTHLSDLMAVPELTLNSPFIAGDYAQRQTRDFNAVDTDIERLPQQILSLVKVGEPRYVVYAWGQSLKPADYTPGIGIGIDPATKVVRNYQITGETATRAVVRIEFDRDSLGRIDYRLPHAVVESFTALPNE